MEALAEEGEVERARLDGGRFEISEAVFEVGDAVLARQILVVIVDGALVGGASLKSDFVEIVRRTVEVKS